jgi:hypothetical protein
MLESLSIFGKGRTENALRIAQATNLHRTNQIASLAFVQSLDSVQPNIWSDRRPAFSNHRIALQDADPCTIL